MNFQKFLLYCTPLSLYLYLRRRKHFPTFVDQFLSYQKEIGKSPGIINKGFKYIVSSQGLGYSGSGVINDYLREYDNVCVFTSTDDGSKTKENHFIDETHLLNQTGGLYEIERFLSSDNIFHNDALLQRFVTMAEHSELFRYNGATKEAYFDFFNNISDGVYKNKRFYYNVYMQHIGDEPYLMYLKKMSIPEYRSICRNFIGRLLGELQTEGKEYLILDQLFQDDEYDMAKNLDYIPNLKLLVSYRDPRDVYAVGFSNDIEWIHHHHDVDKFIYWFKNTRLRNLDFTGSRGYLVLRFEEMVTDYKNQMNRIVEYLDLDTSHHVNPRKYFDPDLSKRGIGVWRKSSVSSNDFDKIYRELKDYCWENA